tara:strand:+ start:338 stop:628 length:291 start_codon:yes stop_codon:yes gene_type:complete
MTGSVCGSAAGAAHRENWQNNLTHARIKSRKTKNTSQRTPKEKLRRQTVGLKKIKLNKIIEEPIFYVYSAHRPSGNLGYSHFHPAKKNCYGPPQNP